MCICGRRGGRNRVWADGIHVTIRLEEARLCLLVLIGVRADGRKELITLADGYRESTESWADLLRDARRRGMRAPVLAVGDGALGFWGAGSSCTPRRCAGAAAPGWPPRRWSPVRPGRCSTCRRSRCRSPSTAWRTAGAAAAP